MKFEKRIWTIYTLVLIHMDKEVKESRGGSAIMKSTKLNYRFHNPNTAEETVEYIAKILIEVNKVKLEQVLRSKSNQSAEQKTMQESHSM